VYFNTEIIFYDIITPL